MMWLLKILKIYLEERDKPFNVAKNPKHDEFQHKIVSVVY